MAYDTTSRGEGDVHFGDGLFKLPFGGDETYLRYVLRAQQELLHLSASLVQRQIEACQRLAVGRWDIGETAAACTDMMKSTIIDYSETTARLMRLASNLGSEASQDAEKLGSTVARNTEEIARSTGEQARSLAEKPLQDAAAASRGEKQTAKK